MRTATLEARRRPQAFAIVQATPDGPTTSSSGECMNPGGLALAKTAIYEPLAECRGTGVGSQSRPMPFVGLHTVHVRLPFVVLSVLFNQV
jgi:hypothetical protein